MVNPALPRDNCCHSPYRKLRILHPPWCSVGNVTYGAVGAQHSPAQPVQSYGLYEYTSFSVGHDSSAGWSSVMDSAVGYSFNQTFAIEAGAPFYPAIQ